MYPRPRLGGKKKKESHPQRCARNPVICMYACRSVGICVCRYPISVYIHTQYDNMYPSNAAPTSRRAESSRNEEGLGYIHNYLCTHARTYVCMYVCMNGRYDTYIARSFSVSLRPCPFLHAARSEAGFYISTHSECHHLWWWVEW